MINKVILMGRLTKDPELVYGERPYARYMLAVSRSSKKDQEKENADFVPCVVFGKRAEWAAKYLKKGTKICICGRVRTGQYEKNGEMRFSMTIVVDEQDFAGGKLHTPENLRDDPNGEPDQNMENGEGYMDIPDDIDDGLPFA